MKKIICVLALCSSIAVGGTTLTMSHSINGSVQPRSAAAHDTLRILAILVQFQQDTDPNSTGNGQFDLTNTAQRIIDAPPRDSAYFADHFFFAQNYFRKVSHGRQAVASTVLGRVITLRNKIQAYAPAKRTATNADVVNLPLTAMIDEAWHAADSLNPGFPFQQYDLFVIFHAGPGKDVNLSGNVNLDLTPYDIPSLYFNLPSLQKLRGPAYAGVKLGSNFFVTNSVILPETENRTVSGGAGDYLLQLSINGLIVSNIASALGLPDLFDTRTGGTAIGRFGLMDGQSIFSYFGLFPPEPSAWERAYLGWADELTVPAGTVARTIQLTAGGDTVLKVPISAKEYFLLENRQRDRNKDGETLTIRWNGTQFTKTYLKDDDHFNAANVDSIYGTVIDADEFDWSLPGLINDSYNYHGGILIWHIDEAVIEKNLATNSINADENHRGVDLEEADGSQDIGQSYGFLDPGSGTEDGSPLDYWFSENLNPKNNPIYANEFSETTHPNSLSNSLAHSHVMIKNFSASAPVMSLDVTSGGGVALAATVKRLSAKQTNGDAPIVADINGDGADEIVYTSGEAIYALTNGLAPFPGNPDGLFSTTGGKFQPALVNTFSLPGKPYLAGVKDSTITLYATGADGRGVPELSLNAGATISTPVMIRGPVTQAQLLTVGTMNGTIVEFTFDAKFSTQMFASPIRFLASTMSGWYAATDDSLGALGPKKTMGLNGRTVIAIASFLEPNAGPCAAVLLSNNDVSIVDYALQTLATWRVPANVNASLAVSDVNGDGRNDILIGTERGVYAYTTTGALIEHFPLKVTDGGVVAGSPIIVRTKDAAAPVVCFGSTNGQAYAYGADGKLLPGFPLQTGGIVSSLTVSSKYLIGASTDSSVYAWNIEGLFDLTKASWSNYLADAAHSNYSGAPAAGVEKSDELLPTALAYNWPNPVYNGTTHIRYYVGSDATVTVKIFTMAGASVATLSGSGRAHMDNEIDWDVSAVQSGIYFAQLEATSSGRTSSTIIKIAVVK